MYSLNAEPAVDGFIEKLSSDFGGENLKLFPADVSEPAIILALRIKRDPKLSVLW